MITFTDAEQAFADSAEGRAKIAYQRNKFEMGQAHKGTNARPWTDAMETDAVRELTTRQARSAVAMSATLADAARQEPKARDARDAAYDERKDRMRNAWRGQ